MRAEHHKGNAGGSHMHGHHYRRLALMLLRIKALCESIKTSQRSEIDQVKRILVRLNENSEGANR